MRTEPALIAAGRAPSAAEVYTYRQAILELQAKIDYSYVWTVDSNVSAVTIAGIPPELATLELVCMVESTDEVTFEQPPVVFAINGDESPSYDFHHTTISGVVSPGSFAPVIFAEERDSEVYGFCGIAKGQMPASRPTTSKVTFGNWGTGTQPLCYTGHFNSSSQSTLCGGVCNISRPYTSITLWTTGSVMAGSSFTILGRYP